MSAASPEGKATEPSEPVAASPNSVTERRSGSADSSDADEADDGPQDRPACRIIGLCCLVLLFCCSVFALQSPELYVTDVTLGPPAAATGTRAKLTYGLFRKCSTVVPPSGADGTTLCSDATKYTELSLGACEVSVSQQRQSFVPVMGGALFAVFLAVVAVPWYLCCDGRCVGRFHANFGRAAHSIAALIASGAAFLFYAYTMRAWYFCGVRYCELVTNVRHNPSILTCTDTPGYAAYVYAVGVFAAFVAAVLALAGWDCTSPGRVKEEPASPPRDRAVGVEVDIKPDTVDRKPDTASEYDQVEFDEAAAPGAPAPGTFGGADDDTDEWEWDEGSQMYWSEQQQLFLHVDEGTGAQTFYDPVTHLWCGSDGEWHKEE